MIDRILYYYIPLIFDLIKAFALSAILTAVIETVFFAFTKNNHKNFLFFVFFVNIVSNILLNIWLSYAKILSNTITYGEITVILSEFALFCIFLKPKFRNALILFVQTIFANVLSYSFGLLLFKFMGIL